MDVRIELWTRWLIGQVVQWSLIGWNRVTEAWDGMNEYCMRIFSHLEHVHKRDVWMFINENELPYCVKEGQHTIQVKPSTLFYYPDTNTFLLNTRLQANRTERFDVVSVHIRHENSSLRDITGFFHSVTWKPNSAPSLWEVVEVYFLHQYQPIAHSQKQNWSLIVLDSNAEEHEVFLNGPIARRRFVGWT